MGGGFAKYRQRLPAGNSATNPGCNGEPCIKKKPVLEYPTSDPEG